MQVWYATSRSSCSCKLLTYQGAPALGLKNLEPPDVTIGSIPPNCESVIHHGTYELLVQHQSIPDWKTAAPVQKRTKYPKSLGCSHLTCSMWLAHVSLLSTHWISSLRDLSGQGVGMHPVMKSTTPLLPTLMAILQSRNHISNSLRYVSWYLSRSVGC